MLLSVLAVVIGIYSSHRKRFLPCNGAFIVPSTVSTDGVVTVQDIIEGIEWLLYARQWCGYCLGSSWEWHRLPYYVCL